MRTLLKNPCLRFCTSRDALLMVGRGPHRIWLPHPLSAGCDVMEDRAITSRVVVVVSAVVCWSCRGCWRVWFGARKMGEGVVRVGRRVGRWEKVLRFEGIG